MDGHHINSEEHDILTTAGIERILAERLDQPRVIIQSVFNEIRPNGSGALRLDFLLANKITEAILWIDDQTRYGFTEEQITQLGKIAMGQPTVDRHEWRQAS